MRDLIEVINERVVSAFPLSIGTSLAFESLFEGRQAPYDPARELPPKVNISEYDILLINVSTLIRNIIASISKDDVDSLSYSAISMALDQEIETILDIMHNEGQDRLSVFFYVRDYKFVHKESSTPIVIFRAPNTEKQKRQHDLIQSVELNCSSMNTREYIHKVSKSLYPPVPKKALIMSHMAYDLLSVKSFKALDLLESYTGVLKKRKEYYTKFYEGKKLGLNNIPFIRKMLAIFGDDTIYRPMPLKIRNQVIELSKNRRWTAITTSEQVKNDIYYHQADLGLKKEYPKM